MPDMRRWRLRASLSALAAAGGAIAVSLAAVNWGNAGSRRMIAGIPLDIIGLSLLLPAALIAINLLYYRYQQFLDRDDRIS